MLLTCIHSCICRKVSNQYALNFFYDLDAHFYLTKQVSFVQWQDCVVEWDIGETCFTLWCILNELLELLDNKVYHLLLFLVHK